MTNITIDEDGLGPLSRLALLLFLFFGLTVGALETAILRSIRRAFK